MSIHGRGVAIRVARRHADALENADSGIRSVDSIASRERSADDIPRLGHPRPGRLIELYALKAAGDANQRSTIEIPAVDDDGHVVTR
jgi:hypothetical protein